MFKRKTAQAVCTRKYAVHNIRGHACTKSASWCNNLATSPHTSAAYNLQFCFNLHMSSRTETNATQREMFKTPATMSLTSTVVVLPKFLLCNQTWKLLLSEKLHETTRYYFQFFRKVLSRKNSMNIQESTSRRFTTRKWTTSLKASTEQSSPCVKTIMEDLSWALTIFASSKDQNKTFYKKNDWAFLRASWSCFL